MRRVRARVDGTVQGVGYRPFVYRLADELGIAGWVLNDERGVLVEAEGPADAVEAFVARLSADAPPLAEVRARAGRAGRRASARAGFEIVASERGGAATAPVTPDSATCADCLAELADPEDRRYRYPFLNCTNCGPRFTIVQGIPYDRPLTTMAGFEMCDACRAEYEDPLDRRFHAQPNACPVCGPQVRLLGRNGNPTSRASRTRCAPPRRTCSTARSSPSRAWAATTSPAAPTARRPSPRCARASTARTARSRCSSPTSTPPAGSSSSTPTRRRC